MAHCATIFPTCFVEAEADSDYCIFCKRAQEEAGKMDWKLKPEAFSSNKSTHKKGSEK